MLVRRPWSLFIFYGGDIFSCCATVWLERELGLAWLTQYIPGFARVCALYTVFPGGATETLFDVCLLEEWLVRLQSTNIWTWLQAFITLLLDRIERWIHHDRMTQWWHVQFLEIEVKWRLERICTIETAFSKTLISRLCLCFSGCITFWCHSLNDMLAQWHPQALLRWRIRVALTILWILGLQLSLNLISARPIH